MPARREGGRGPRGRGLAAGPRLAHRGPRLHASAGSPGPGQAVAGLLRDGAQRVVVATYLLALGVFADQVRDQALAAGARAVSAPLAPSPS